jgi:nitrogen fixation protein NifB
VRCDGIVYRGPRAAEIVIEEQQRGIRAAIEAGLTLKVNSVLIPGINDRHMVRLARRLVALGVHLMNIMPLIPGGQMAGRRPPTCDELRQVRADCEDILPQFRLCEQCRADVVRFPGAGL